jgi:radical SAM/Cys-rich protein
MHATLPLLAATDFPPIRRRTLDTLQVNLGYKCNQSCLHCHVAASPQRTEMMDGDTIALVIEVLQSRRVGTLDLTGGAPELNLHFRDLVRAARAARRPRDRSLQPDHPVRAGQEDLAAFLAGQGVEVTASLPCYSPANVDRQRGDGVFERSITGLRQLNALGYGDPARGLVLNLVYNPQGPSLPPPQGPLEADYKRELLLHFGIRFDHLFALTNMPIQRFGSTLVSKGTFGSYMKLLRDSYRADNLDTVMCRSLLSVDWQGFLYDCDFNQMLGLRARLGGRPRAASSRPAAARPGGRGHPHRRPLLRLHGRPGQQLRRSAGACAVSTACCAEAVPGGLGALMARSSRHAGLVDAITPGVGMTLR